MRHLSCLQILRGHQISQYERQVTFRKIESNVKTFMMNKISAVSIKAGSNGAGIRASEVSWASVGLDPAPKHELLETKTIAGHPGDWLPWS